MVEFMVLHPDLAKGLLNVSNAKSKSRELWERLSQDLNAAGPPSHNVEKWKKVWADYKQHIKVKSRRNKLCLSGTGGGQSNYCSLTPLEERVSELLAFNSYIQGMSNTSRYGAPASTSAIGNIEEKDEAIGDDEGIETNGKALDLDCAKQSSNNFLTIHTPSSRSRDLFNKQTLLQKQVENQIKYQENSIELLRQCNNNQKALMKKINDMNKNLSSANKYLKRNVISIFSQENYIFYV